MSRKNRAQQEGMRVIHSNRPSVNIHGGEGSMLEVILRKARAIDAESNTGSSVGEVPELIDKHAARTFRDFNATHAICIDAKVSTSVGMGHRDRDIYDILNPLTRFGWQDVLDALGEDYVETGECFLEVAFNDEESPKMVTGLFHLESAAVTPIKEREDSEDMHYRIDGEIGDGAQRIMAQWGDREDLLERMGGSPGESGSGNANDARPPVFGTGQITRSVVVHIRQSTNRSRHRGYPDYMSAVPSMELVQCMTQHEFDFYFNRGVPEFILFLIGRNVGKSWGEVENLIKANQGPGNTHKTGGVHIPGSPDDTVVQLEKLAMEDAGNSGFSEKSDTLDMRIATAHGMPPQLANIALPGKIGGANEGPNAMLTFQKRKLGRTQKNFSNAFACTLAEEGITFASPTGSGGGSISADQFLGTKFGPVAEDEVTPQYVEPGNGFSTILDGMTLGAMETLNSMREPIAGSDRNPSEGKLGGTDERRPSDPRRTR